MKSLSARLSRALCSLFALLVVISPGGLGAGPLAAASASASSLLLPEKDTGLQEQLELVLQESPFRALVQSRRLSVALVDLSDQQVRFAAVQENVMRYAASLPKIAVMLAVFDQVADGRLEYTPKLQQSLEKMIRHSSNREASRLIELVGFEAIEAVLCRPEYELYDPDRKGGLWVGKDYGGSLGRWKRDPINNISHGATARQVARFMVLIERGELINAWSSQEMKRIMGDPKIHHKFVKGLATKTGTKIYRKSGTWKAWHSDAAIVERDGKTYVAVALMESTTKGVLARLITRLDSLIE